MTPLIVLGRFRRLEGLLGPSSRQEPAGNAGDDLGALPVVVVMLVDEGIDVALGIGDILQCGAGGAEPLAVRGHVCIGQVREWPGRSRPVRFGQLCKGRVGELDHPLLQVLQALLAQGRRQSPDEAVVLPVGVLGERFEGPFGQLMRIGPDGAGDVAEIGAGAKDVHDRAGIIMAAVQGRVRYPHVVPDQVEGLAGILRGKAPDDDLSEGLQLVLQFADLLQVEGRARAADRRQTTPHFPGKLGRSLRAGKLKPEQPPGPALAGADFDDQLGQALSAESFQVPGVESFLRCHLANGSHICVDEDDLDLLFRIAQ